MKIATRTSALSAALAAAFAPATAGAVSLGSDGRGQALIYPYYTVQSAGNNPFNTYLSVVNHTAQAKALRVRVREGRNSREVASFNLYLSPNDVWTGAVVPQIPGEAPRLVTADNSCTLPRLAGTLEAAPGITFQNTLYSGAFDDSNGTGLDRTREGWVEIIEMATLTGALATAVTHNSAGTPANCAVLQSPGGGDIAAPTGGLSGTLTLINVASGMDFTLNAEALADLSTRSFFRPPTDPYPDLNVVEIDPVSVVLANGFMYRSAWNRAADAVSAVLMRSAWLGEFVLDAGTRSKTDFQVTFPTRQYYFTGPQASPPFAGSCNFPLDTFAGEPAAIRYFNREERTGLYRDAAFPTPPVATFRCAAAAAFDFSNGALHLPNSAATQVLGSQNRALTEGTLTMPPAMPNGWVAVTPTSGRVLTSLGSSTRVTLATGAVTTGSHAFSGLPVVGFTARTFENGTLACSTGACQGNYGGAFPLKYRRSVAPN
jgi:hypothetical protein